MQTEEGKENTAVATVPAAPEPIDRLIGIVEDAGTALGFAKRIFESAKSVFGSRTPVKDILDDAGARAAKARADTAARKRTS